MSHHLILITQLSRGSALPEECNRSCCHDYCCVPWSSGSDRTRDWHDRLLTQEPIHYGINQNMCLDLHLFVEKQESLVSPNEEEMSNFKTSHSTLRLWTSIVKMLTFKILKPALLTWFLPIYLTCLSYSYLAGIFIIIFIIVFST